MMIRKFIKSIMPSTRTGKDPLRCVMSDDSECPYQPIPLGELKLTHWIRRKIYKNRINPIIINKPDCNKKLNIIVPYRHREEHLKTFPKYLKDFLTKQKISNNMLVIEQKDNKPFNKGKLLNIAISLANEKCDYFCFHDIDMLPQNASYAYINHPLLLANSVSQFDKEPNHPTYFGGVILLSREDVIKTNGFSNNYWHWGYEDDDFHLRCLFSGLTPVSYTNGRFTSLPHKKSITQTSDGNYHEDKKILANLNALYQKNKKYYKKMRRGLVDYTKEGLNTVTFEIVNREQNEFYEKISVRL